MHITGLSQRGTGISAVADSIPVRDLFHQTQSSTRATAYPPMNNPGSVVRSILLVDNPRVLYQNLLTYRRRMAGVYVPPLVPQTSSAIS